MPGVTFNVDVAGHGHTFDGHQDKITFDLDTEKLTVQYADGNGGFSKPQPIQLTHAREITDGRDGVIRQNMSNIQVDIDGDGQVDVNPGDPNSTDVIFAIYSDSRFGIMATPNVLAPLAFDPDSYTATQDITSYVQMRGGSPNVITGGAGIDLNRDNNDDTFYIEKGVTGFHAIAEITPSTAYGN